MEEEVKKQSVGAPDGVASASSVSASSVSASSVSASSVSASSVSASSESDEPQSVTVGNESDYRYLSRLKVIVDKYHRDCLEMKKRPDVAIKCIKEELLKIFKRY